VFHSGSRSDKLEAKDWHSHHLYRSRSEALSQTLGSLFPLSQSLSSSSDSILPLSHSGVAEDTMSAPGISASQGIKSTPRVSTSQGIKLTPGSNVSGGILSIPQSSVKEGSIHCNVCGKSFTHQFSRRRHEQKCQGTHNFMCIVCGYKTHRKDHFTLHMQRRHKDMDLKDGGTQTSTQHQAHSQYLRAVMPMMATEPIAMSNLDVSHLEEESLVVSNPMSDCVKKEFEDS